MRFRLPALSHTPTPDLPVEAASIVRWRAITLAMLVVGAVILELGLAVGWVITDRPMLVHVSAAMFVALAVAVKQYKFSGYRPFTRIVLAVTIVLITVLEASMSGVHMVPIFYIWPLLGAAYLLSRIELIVCFAVVGAACAIGMESAARGGPFPTRDYVLLLTVGVAIVATVRSLGETVGATIGSLRHTSSTDPLTGLLNRRSFNHRFARHYGQSVLAGHPLTALLMDVDHFKAINDEHGHAVGDRALQRFTELLKHSCRTSDLVARVGGEEFAVVMPGATITQAITRAEQFSSILRDDRSIDGVRMTVSVGVATRDRHTDGWESMLVAADTAVYRAKRSGRDRIILADPASAGAAADQAALR